MEPVPVREAQDAPAFFRALAKVEIAVVGVILIASLVITLFTIVERNIGHSTGDWTLKLPELMLGWMTYLGMAALVTERGHVAADMLLVRMPRTPQRVAETFSAIVTSVVLAVIIVGAVEIVRQQVAIGATDDELWDIPSAVLLSILPVGLVLTILHLLADIYTIWRPGRAR